MVYELHAIEKNMKIQTRETETETPDPAVWRDCRCVVGVQLGKWGNPIYQGVPFKMCLAEWVDTDYFPYK